MVDNRRLGPDHSPADTQNSFNTSRSSPNLPIQGQTNPPQSWLANADNNPDPNNLSVPLDDLSRHSSHEEDEDNEWNSSHPCFPHRNPHVPKDSSEYESTRVIRVGRDYMYSGDLSPAFSNIYPEILEGFVSEERFREVIRRVNTELYRAHNPWGIANIVEGMVGFFTLWVYEDLVHTTAKRRIESLDRYIEEVNGELERENTGVKIIPLRTTGYLNLDFQIPNPGIDEEDDVSESSDEEEGMTTALANGPPPGAMNGQPYP